MSRIWVNATQLPQLLLGHWNSEPILDGKCFWDSRFTITQAQKELRKHHLCDETHQSDGGWFSEIPRIKPGTLIFILPWGTLSPCWTFMDQAIEFMSRSSFSRKLTQCIATYKRNMRISFTSISRKVPLHYLDLKGWVYAVNCHQYCLTVV
jgi:hypothetical protein